MLGRRALLLTGMAAMVSACSGGTKGNISTSSYRGPQVTRVIVAKQRRMMFLMNGDRVLKKYKIGLGFAPYGPKRVEGDGKTPEGRYTIDRRNPNSSFFLSLGISYPNQWDVERAQLLGQEPGGDIFIHGQSTKRPDGRDWTAGCISVKNRHMRQIYRMVRDGTVIDIYP